MRALNRFDTVLVANRAEIALRVIRAAAGCGLRSVAVYSDADRDAAHTRAADQAVRIGPAAARDSYLSIPALLDAAARTGAGAIHPGYGFLAESAEFARAVTDAGLVFIGPPAAVVEAMGRKDHARQIALDAGVPVLPAADDGGNPAVVLEQVGFPLLVKAAFGGGGKGMRIVRSAVELPEAVGAARREALAAFGDDTMIFERYVEHGRHIEVQIIADEHGHVLHLFERDCSVQRRHQKVVEEAPATSISASVRELLLGSAVALASHVGYTNAGTVEFLVSGENAYFLEMNTRLQVEHPVTELVTGLDLVALQLSVAQGEPLPVSQDEVRMHGHAIEARVYAEDPAHAFVPQTGVVTHVSWPRQARVDAALEPGQRVGTSYDPMLGKIIVSGQTREAARRALVDALDETAILGLRTNVGFLRTLADSAAYRDLAIDTAWLDSHLGHFEEHTPDEAWWIAAWTLCEASRDAEVGPFGSADGWRLGAEPAGIPVELSVAGTRVPAGSRLMVVHLLAGLVEDGGRQIAVRLAHRVDAPGTASRFEIDARVHRATVDVGARAVTVAYHGQTHVFERPDAFRSSAGDVALGGAVTAPMPGTVTAVQVTVGEEVAEGDTLGVMEAMKMELSLTAPIAGVLTEVRAVTGDQVELGAQLFLIASAEPLEPGTVGP